MNTNKAISILIGRKIKSLRSTAGYTASQFAKLTGCKSEQQLYRYERAINKIDIDTLVLMLKRLNVNISLFFEQIINEAAEMDKEADDNNAIICSTQHIAPIDRNG
ncbi:helix-turn-helix transcriptional regulator [Providencia rettgeri]|uniref:helix-turn-helix domain-containing protein n=1 Tax=Providencia rettgeri TaxID=587 RepID=UPI002446EC45|nr:helix-turn-helix transcriptional regulator [Providencia rettgeri]MDH2379564.1 helix-turn-helix transcriptional regulator [Providencia rettgeri]MDW7803600.1 helix-turn-helix transcriptional regulator [Providencia rettgeri]